MRPEDRQHARQLAIYAQMHTTEAFATCDDPLEAALFSVLIEALTKLDAIADAEGTENK